MTKKPPSFPRLHVADQPTVPPTLAGDNVMVAAIAEAFHVATGWVLSGDAESHEQPWRPQTRLTIKRADQDDEESSNGSSIERWRAEKLADTLSDLIERLGVLQAAVRDREAELAAGVPVPLKRPDEEHLAARLEIMLRNGAQAIDCCAAGLYLLDEATSELKLRACWGLPGDRLLEPARPLVDAFAELEAMIGHAVVLVDTSLAPNWKVPESYPAAICLPVASPTDPLGTIWFFAETMRDFSDHDVHLAEIVAGSIAAELQREVLLGECLAARQTDQQITHALRWQQEHLPTVKPLVDTWDVAAWSATGDAGFYDWFVPPDGSLAVALGTCDGAQIESRLGAAALQASVRAHAEHAHHAASLITRVNDTIWNSSAGGHFASLFYGKASDECGELEYAAAGAVQAILVQQSDIGLIEPGASSLGIDPEVIPERTCVRMADRDVLLILSSSSQRPSAQLELGRQIRLHRDRSVDELLQLVRSLDTRAGHILLLQRQC